MRDRANNFAFRAGERRDQAYLIVDEHLKIELLAEHTTAILLDKGALNVGSTTLNAHAQSHGDAVDTRRGRMRSEMVAPAQFAGS